MGCLFRVVVLRPLRPLLVRPGCNTHDKALLDRVTRLSWPRRLSLPSYYLGDQYVCSSPPILLAAEKVPTSWNMNVYDALVSGVSE